MAKTIEIPELTEKQASWLKTMLFDESRKSSESADKHHKLSMEAKTTAEVEWLERDAKEFREYANVLLSLAKNI